MCYKGSSLLPNLLVLEASVSIIMACNNGRAQNKWLFSGEDRQVTLGHRADASSSSPAWVV